MWLAAVFRLLEVGQVSAHCYSALRTVPVTSAHSYTSPLQRITYSTRDTCSQLHTTLLHRVTESLLVTCYMHICSLLLIACYTYLHSESTEYTEFTENIHPLLLLVTCMYLLYLDMLQITCLKCALVSSSVFTAKSGASVSTAPSLLAYLSP